jgi:hypothetical protein
MNIADGDYEAGRVRELSHQGHRLGRGLVRGGAASSPALSPVHIGKNVVGLDAILA